MDAVDNLVNDAAPEEEEEEEEEESEEEEEEEEEEEDDEDEPRDGVLEGGVAEEVEKGKEKRKAAQADLCLFLTCTKPLSFCPEHPVIKHDVTVQIGLDRSVKLEKVFQRYVEFCNEQYPEGKVEVSELEFAHSHVLSPHDNAEAASLMKNDRLQVRPEASEERKEEEQRHRMQRDMDKEYFTQMRKLLPSKTCPGRRSVHQMEKCADVIFDCRGSYPLPEDGEQEQTPDSLSPDKLIRAHSFLIQKRCPLLGKLITEAKAEHKRRSVVTVPEENKSDASDDEDDFEMLQNLNNDEKPQNEDSSNAAQIENDEDEHVPESVRSSRRRNSNLSQNDGDGANADDEDSFSSAISLPTNLPVVVMEEYPAGAVKLLLEYCYTNRCAPLGYEAFMQTAKINEEQQLLYRKALAGPVAPYSYRPTRWPNGGEPVVSFAVALAGIRLAEEFELPRFSLMCEIAAGQLLDEYTAMDALQECEKQRLLTGNELPRLRKEAMQVILRSCAIGGGTAGIINSALEDRCRLVVPSLFTGAMEAVKEAEEKKKNSKYGEEREWQRKAFQYLETYDKNDERERDRERRKRKRGMDPGEETDDEDDDNFSGWGEAKARRMSLKRMSHHLRSGTGLDLLTRSRKSRRIAS